MIDVLFIQHTVYTLFQNGVRKHESEARGARFYEIIIGYTTRERFSYISAHFLAKKIFHSYMDNSKPLKMKFTAKFVPYDVLLCYNHKIFTARSDDNSMAISTVSSYEKLDYNRPCVQAIYRFRSASTTVLCSGQFVWSVYKANKPDKVDMFLLCCGVKKYCVHHVF